MSPNQIDNTHLLTATNHELMKLVTARVKKQLPMSMIAQELSVDVDALCDWILRVYREPKKKPYQNKNGGPIGQSRMVEGNEWSRSAQARRQHAWEKQREGARAALQAMEAE